MKNLSDYINYTKTLPEYRPYRTLNGKKVAVIQVYGVDFVKFSDIILNFASINKQSHLRAKRKNNEDSQQKRL